MSGETLLLQDAGSKETANAVIKSSRKFYAKKYKDNIAKTKKPDAKHITEKIVPKSTEPEPLEA